MSTDSVKNKLIAARYGRKEQPENIIWNTQIEGLLNHRSVRKFSQRALPEFWFETLVAAAQSASTSSNLQQWSVVAVTDPELKKKVRNLSAGDKGLANKYIEEAPAILLWIADFSRNQDMTISDNLEPLVHDYLDSFVMVTVDAALASQNAVVAAESIGLGTVYIGATRNKARELAELIQLPKHSYVVCGLVVGWPSDDDDAAIRPRLPQSVVAHNNFYEAEDLEAHISAYEEAFLEFREGLGMKDKTWRQAVQSAATSLEYMDGRQNLRVTLEDRGFGFE